MTREELDELTKKSEEMLEKSMKAFTDALMANIRLQVQRDLLFLETGDKTLVNR